MVSTMALKMSRACGWRAQHAACRGAAGGKKPGKRLPRELRNLAIPDRTWNVAMPLYLTSAKTREQFVSGIDESQASATPAPATPAPAPPPASSAGERASKKSGTRPGPAVPRFSPHVVGPDANMAFLAEEVVGQPVCVPEPAAAQPLSPDALLGC